MIPKPPRPAPVVHVDRRPRFLRILHGTALAALGVVAGGCAGTREAAGDADAATAKPAAARSRDKQSAASKFAAATQENLASVRNQDLRLTRWLAAGSTVSVPAGTPITMKLGDAGRLAGKGPVNRYFGAAQVAVDGSGRLTWPNAAFGMSRMAGPPEAMALEAKFVQALASTSKLLVGESGLRFENADASTVLEFTR